MTIKKFRKKPVIIEAIQYNGNNEDEIEEFVGKTLMTYTTWPPMLAIPTLEGTMSASVRDWIIKEPFDKERGCYPCKSDIFEKTYEEVQE
jgi:hypothetical protein